MPTHPTSSSSVPSPSLGIQLVPPIPDHGVVSHWPRCKLALPLGLKCFPLGPTIINLPSSLSTSTTRNSSNSIRRTYQRRITIRIYSA
ncbi:hypothetical protein HZ326_27721 [Fusarium oxysporum f. sp. albedinis]|nr:hypothetical protein HZ326_27721 [Fusarium oxysporum f. sp. albedinis]